MGFFYGGHLFLFQNRKKGYTTKRLFYIQGRRISRFCPIPELYNDEKVVL